MNKAQTDKALAPIIETLSGIPPQLESIVNDRNTYAEERSERWRESEAGEAYEEVTSAIENALNALETDIIPSLEE